MRFLFPLVFLLTATATIAAEVDIVRVWPEYRRTDSFKRIGEYFGGTEARRGETILRTQADSRDGYYFLTRLKSQDAFAGAMIVVESIRPEHHDADVHFFPVDLPKGRHVFLVGLTGTDWATPKRAPLAWQIRILSSDGTELARKRSFLWEMPVTTPDERNSGDPEHEG